MNIRSVSVGVLAILFLLSVVFVYGAVSVTLNTPADREVLSGTYTINASFDDTVNITIGVNDGGGWVQVNSSTDVSSSPYLYSLVTSSYADQNGTFSINVTIVNGSDAADVDVAIAVNLSIDNDAPFVNVLTPSGTIDGLVNATINASYSENGTLVMGCNFTITNSTGSAMLSNVPLTLSGGLNNGFASGTLQANNFSEGAGYTVNVTCLDGSGRLGMDTSNFGYDTGTPMAFLTIISYARAIVSLTGTATDGLSVQNLSVVAENATGNYTACTNSSPGFISNGFLCSWDTTTFNDDSYDLTLTVQDAVGRTNTSAVTGVTLDNTKPSVVFVTPSAGANVTGTFNITIQVTDATAGVNATQVFLSNGTGGNLLAMSLVLGDVNLGNWSVLVDTTLLPEGNQVFTANVSDKASNTNLSVSLTLTVDNNDPFAFLDAVPSIVHGLVNLTGSATDAATFMNYTVIVLNATSGDVVAEYPRYATVSAGLLIDGWDTTTIPDGVYNLSLAVYDFFGGSNTSMRGDIRIDNTNPSVTLVLPTAGVTYSGFVTVNATLVDTGAGINSTGSYPRIVIDGSAWALSLVTGTVSDGLWSGSANTVIKSDGANTLSIEAKDNASNQNYSVSISIFIDNTNPELVITSPASTAYTQSDPLVVNFTATDYVATVLRCNLSATNGTASGFNYSDTVANATPTLLTIVVGPGDWLWNVTCWDNATQDGVPLSGNSNTSVSRNYIVDSTPGGIESVTLEESDSFISDNATNNRITVLVNATDEVSGVAEVLVNFSVIPGNGLGIVSADFDAGTGLWNASAIIIDASVFDFQNFTISVSATDNAANALTGPNTVTVVLYNMTMPPSDPSGCTAFGSLTTDMSEETDFSDVNFLNEIQLNGSAACNIFGQALPWGGTFQTVLLLNFTSVDMSDPASGALLSQLMDAIQVNITLPGQFGDSRIFVDSAFFSALNTSTRLTFYGLPFTAVPTVVADDLAEQAGISAITWASAFDPNYNYTTGNLSFTVVGFSGYDVADNATPTVAINYPTSGLNTTDNTTLINVTLNGTGSPISQATFFIGGTLYGYYNATGNTANCLNTTVGGELYTCIFSTSALTDGAKTLTVVAYDYGGDSPGNNANATRSFRVDAIGPSVTVTSPSADEYVQPTYEITGTVSDVGTGILSVVISVNGTVVGNATVNGTAWNYTRASAHGRVENITANATDLSDNAVAAAVTGILVDGVGPIFSSIASDPSTTSAVITWTTDEAANESVNYGTTTGLGTTSVSATYDTSHSRTLSSLSADTTYYYNLTSCDQATNCNTTGPLTFTTDETSGGGGSGGGAFVPAPALASAPKAVSLSRYGSYKFLAKGSTEQHTLTIKEIRSDGVLFLLRSTPIEVFLKAGETKEIDVTGDTKPDVSLTLMSFSTQTAFIKIGQSSAATATPATPPPTTPTAPTVPTAPVIPPATPPPTPQAQPEPVPTTAPETTDDTPAKEGGIVWWVWALVFVVVIVVFVLLFGGKKKEPEYIPAHVSAPEHHVHK